MSFYLISQTSSKFGQRYSWIWTKANKRRRIATVSFLKFYFDIRLMLSQTWFKNRRVGPRVWCQHLHFYYFPVSLPCLISGQTWQLLTTKMAQCMQGVVLLIHQCALAATHWKITYRVYQVKISLFLFIVCVRYLISITLSSKGAINNGSRICSLKRLFSFMVAFSPLSSDKCLLSYWKTSSQASFSIFLIRVFERNTPTWSVKFNRFHALFAF